MIPGHNKIHKPLLINANIEVPIAQLKKKNVYFYIIKYVNETFNWYASLVEKISSAYIQSLQETSNLNIAFKIILNITNYKLGKITNTKSKYR